MGSNNIGVHRIMKIYPSLPAHTTKDFYEIIEPLDIIELECECNEIEENWKYADWYAYSESREMCQSCKQYRVQTLLEGVNNE